MLRKLFHTKINAPALSVSLLLLRVAAGAGMLPHGLQKWERFEAKSSGFSDPFGIGGPASMSLTIFAELFCAALVLLGLLTRLACIPLIIAMAVAVFYAHNGQVFGDGETAALYGMVYLALLLTGPGKYSMDRLIGK